ncbi:MAG: hypothetical protein FWC60_06725 [Firmicutes bacterium]|nr:hypothetical protein [Bacillota bacterium]
MGCGALIFFSFATALSVTVQCLLILKVNTVHKTVNRKRFLSEHERTVYSMFEVGGSRFETMQCSLVLQAPARKAINRKRFLEEYERTVNSFTGRLNADNAEQ